MFVSFNVTHIKHFSLLEYLSIIKADTNEFICFYLIIFYKKIQVQRRKTLKFFNNNQHPEKPEQKGGKPIMKYETTRKQFYEEKLHEIAGEIAEMIDKGYQVEICRSRSGVKIYSVSKKHHVISKGGNVNV